jgi:hypothetical protein
VTGGEPLGVRQRPLCTADINSPCAVSPDISQIIPPSRFCCFAQAIFCWMDQAPSKVYHWPPAPVKRNVATAWVSCRGVQPGTDASRLL